jgi:hypothetical protein
VAHLEVLRGKDDIDKDDYGGAEIQRLVNVMVKKKYDKNEVQYFILECPC